MDLPAMPGPPAGTTIRYPRRRGRLVTMTTVPLTSWALLRGQLAYLEDQGFDVTLVSSPGADLAVASAQEGVHSVAVPMTRDVSPLADVVALWRLCRLLAALRPTVTSVSTPKAGLLGGLAGVMTRVPCRVYTLRGLRLETVRGPRWAVLWLAEWIACRAAHRVVCVGPSLLRRAESLGLVRAGRAVVLGAGTSNGVDAGRFAPSAQLVLAAAQLRRRFHIPAGAPVVGFVGRLTRDKGLIELVEAHRILLPRFPELRLLLVGDVEQDNGLPPPTVTALESLPGIVGRAAGCRQQAVRTTSSTATDPDESDQLGRSVSRGYFPQ